MLQAKFWASDLVVDVIGAIEDEQDIEEQWKKNHPDHPFPETNADTYNIGDDTAKDLMATFQDTINEVIQLASTMVTNPCERNRILEMQHTAR